MFLALRNAVLVDDGGEKGERESKFGAQKRLSAKLNVELSDSAGRKKDYSRLRSDLNIHACHQPPRAKRAGRQDEMFLGRES